MLDRTQCVQIFSWPHTASVILWSRKAVRAAVKTAAAAAAYYAKVGYRRLYPTVASGFLLDFLKSGSTALIPTQMIIHHKLYNYYKLYYCHYINHIPDSGAKDLFWSQNVSSGLFARSMSWSQLQPGDHWVSGEDDFYLSDGGGVAKCQFFYTDHFCPTKFTPRKSA